MSQCQRLSVVPRRSASFRFLSWLRRRKTTFQRIEQCSKEPSKMCQSFQGFHKASTRLRKGFCKASSILVLLSSRFQSVSAGKIATAKGTIVRMTCSANRSKQHDIAWPDAGCRSHPRCLPETKKAETWRQQLGSVRAHNRQRIEIKYDELLGNRIWMNMI